MSSGKVLMGVLAGVAAGAFLGILFAPDKGSATRKNISGKADDYLKGMKQKFNEYLESVSEEIHSAKEEAMDKGKDLMDKAKNAASEQKRNVTNTPTENFSPKSPNFR